MGQRTGAHMDEVMRLMLWGDSGWPDQGATRTQLPSLGHEATLGQGYREGTWH